MKIGVLSTAKIGRKSVLPAIQSTDHSIGAIGSRSADDARALAEQFDVSGVHGSYDALVSDDTLDAVYIPLPNALHGEWVRRAADAGLHVLCEKPLAEDAQTARELVEYCSERGVVLMEGFMYRYHPRTKRISELIDSRLGRLTSFKSAFKFPLRDRPDDIRLLPELAGGSLMDVGCYPINAARTFMGEPTSVSGWRSDSRDAGVDTEMTAVLAYDDGTTATVESGFDSQMEQYYRIDAENGWIRTETAFDVDSDASVSIEYVIDGEHETEGFEPVDQYAREITAFAEAIEEGVPPETDGNEAVRNMRVIDAVVESDATGERITL